jgi:hypothetical protein
MGEAGAGYLFIKDAKTPQKLPAAAGAFLCFFSRMGRMFVAPVHKRHQDKMQQGTSQNDQEGQQTPISSYADGPRQKQQCGHRHWSQAAKQHHPAAAVSAGCHFFGSGRIFRSSQTFPFGSICLRTRLAAASACMSRISPVSPHHPYHHSHHHQRADKP